MGAGGFANLRILKKSKKNEDDRVETMKKTGLIFVFLEPKKIHCNAQPGPETVTHFEANNHLRGFLN